MENSPEIANCVGSIFLSTTTESVEQVTAEKCAKIAEAYFPYGKVSGKEIAAAIRKSFAR